MRMVFTGKEDVSTETIQTPVDENWYQDLKDVLSIALPEKALVGASMSLNWRMNREDKSVSMEGDQGGKMATIAKKPDEELWYHHIVKNFVLPRENDLSAQPAAGAGELSNLGIGPEKKRRALATTAALKKGDAEKAQSSKGLAPAVIRRPKPEPKGAADIPPSNPDDPIDLESSPERLVSKKAGKRKQSDAETEGQPAKKIQRKKITRRGNLDAFISEPVPEKPISPIPTEPLPVVNEELPPSPLRASVADQLENTEIPESEAEKAVGGENFEADKPVDVTVDIEQITSPEVVDSAGNPQTPDLAAHGERECC
ncbi:hypothetical protein HanPI659440_Chr05g0204301 [Helianthus annuus]|nr:hypothetical protein HanPI659440_Chr05g0204301 [Helianthus annuus]